MSSTINDIQDCSESLNTLESIYMLMKQNIPEFIHKIDVIYLNSKGVDVESFYHMRVTVDKTGGTDLEADKR